MSLGPHEVAVVLFVGSLRTKTGEGIPHRHYGGATPDEKQDQNAAGAELATAKALGAWWEGLAGAKAAGDVRLGDVLIQVRWTAYPFGFLAVYPEDDAGQPFVLVTGALPTFELVGWIEGVDAKTPARWTTRTPRNGGALRCACFVVEQAELYPVEALGRPF